MVGPATLGVNQSARQHIYCESGCLEIPLYSRGLWNDKQRQRRRMEDFSQQRPQLAPHTRKITGCLAEDSYCYPLVRVRVRMFSALPKLKERCWQNNLAQTLAEL